MGTTNDLLEIKELPQDVAWEVTIFGDEIGNPVVFYTGTFISSCSSFAVGKALKNLHGFGPDSAINAPILISVKKAKMPSAPISPVRDRSGIGC